MGPFVRGDVVVVGFPFSDFSQLKKRPALVLAPLPGQDVVLCQITSQSPGEASAVSLEATDFLEGSLHRSSWIRPSRLFTVDASRVHYRAGQIAASKLDQTIDQIIALLR